MEHEWQINTGTVPEGVGPDTVIEVEYRSCGVVTWEIDDVIPTDTPCLWEIIGSTRDIIRWRFV